jgi:hypothetical protein
MLSDAFTRRSTGGHECAGICGGDEQNAFFADRKITDHPSCTGKRMRIGSGSDFVARCVMQGVSCLQVAATVLAVTTASAGARDIERPRVYTNETYVEDATQSATLAMDDPIAVLDLVLNSLPDRVKVYPTENYYYFRFMHAGTPYAGNLRFDPRDRDQGKVQFGYYKDLADWMGVQADTELKGIDTVLDASHGVLVEQIGRLLYRVSHNGKSVVFALNDLSQVKPPPAIIGPDEKFLGPVFDESAIRFFLVYNSKLKMFHYILDETSKVADDFYAAAHADRIVIGRRTGFAFYRDHRLDRKILIGAFEANSVLNTYFDGPFDQLPENFIEGETLRAAIIDADPSVKGKIGRLGHYADGSGRYAIHPYMLYRKESELYRVHRCATSKAKRADYYRCFDLDDAKASDTPPRQRSGKK